MQYVDSNVAREVGGLVGWSGPFWARRYSAIVVSEEESAQVDRFRYILAHGVKENLVERVLDWPGVHAARAILEDTPLKGYWFDRTQEYAARNRGEEFGRLTYATEKTFFLSRLPCWEHLSPEEYRARVAALVEEIKLEAKLARLERGLPVLGLGAILRQNPLTRPNKTKKSPAPRFHAATKAIRDGPGKAYGLFLAAFRDAAEQLKAGDRSARFPLGIVPAGAAIRESAARHAAVGGRRPPQLDPRLQLQLTSASVVVGRGLPSGGDHGRVTGDFDHLIGLRRADLPPLARKLPL